MPKATCKVGCRITCNWLEAHFSHCPYQAFSSLMDRRLYGHKGGIISLTLALVVSVLSVLEMDISSSNPVAWAKHLHHMQTYRHTHTHCGSFKIQLFCHIKAWKVNADMYRNTLNWSSSSHHPSDTNNASFPLLLSHKYLSCRHAKRWIISLLLLSHCQCNTCLRI